MLAARWRCVPASSSRDAIDQSHAAPGLKRSMWGTGIEQNHRRTAETRETRDYFPTCALFVLNDTSRLRVELKFWNPAAFSFTSAEITNAITEEWRGNSPRTKSKRSGSLQRMRNLHRPENVSNPPLIWSLSAFKSPFSPFLQSLQLV